MAKMPDYVKSMLKNQRIVVFSTASKDGIPNAVPIGAKKIIDDETILISNQYFDKTLKNLIENPVAGLTFWDTKSHEGYQIKGTTTIETSGERFKKTAKWIEEIGKAKNKPLKSKGAVILKITDVYCVTSGKDAGKKIA